MNWLYDGQLSSRALAAQINQSRNRAVVLVLPVALLRHVSSTEPNAQEQQDVSAIRLQKRVIESPVEIEPTPITAPKSLTVAARTIWRQDVIPAYWENLNDDGKTDVFATRGGRWRIPYGGTGRWQIVDKSNHMAYQLLFGNFDSVGPAGSRTTDDVAIDRQRLLISHNATSRRSVLSETFDPTADLVLIGDLNVITQDDIFVMWISR